MDYYNNVIKMKKGKLIFAFLLLMLFSNCATVSESDGNVDCAVKGKVYVGKKATGSTRTDIEYYEDGATAYTRPEYEYVCRSPETEAEKERVKEIKSKRKRKGVFFFTSFGVVVALLFGGLFIAF